MKTKDFQLLFGFIWLAPHVNEWVAYAIGGLYLSMSLWRFWKDER